MVNPATPLRPRRPRVVAGVVFSLLTGLNGLLWIGDSALRCLDGCEDTTTWASRADAWQWSAIAWTGVTGFILSVAYAIALAKRHWLAQALLPVAILVSLAPWIISATG